MRKDGSDVAGVGLPAGTKIGKYEIVQRHAMGGQAVVYKAYDSLLDRHVAIKQISSHLAADPQFMERFRREAQILAKLGAEQACIVTIHDLIEDERGLFIVMEFVDGPTLAKVMADTNGPAESKAALQILWRLAGALHAVHAAGIIHRDIKPGNVIIGEGLWPTIMDFGVAASASGQTSMVLGTTRYMAPELFNGGVVDGRADMYSLGFIMYELLLGKPKFDEIFSDVIRDERSATMRWMKWHGNAAVQAPMLHEVLPGTPVALSHVVARMIAKDPDERFDSMEALGKAIKGAFSSRNRGGAAAVAVAAPRSMVSAGGGAMAGAAPGATGAGMALDTDEEPSFDPVPTVRLPKSTLSRKTKLILLATVMVGLLAVVIVLQKKAERERKEFEAMVNAVYNPVEEAYGEGKWQVTADTYEVLRKKAEVTEDRDIAATVQFAKAKTMVRLSRGHIEVAEGDWGGAYNASTRAREALNTLESRFADSMDASSQKKLDHWIDTMDAAIKDFDKAYLDVRSWTDFAKQIESLIENKRYDQALELLRPEKLALGKLDIDADKNIQIATWQGEINQRQFMDAFRAVTKDAETKLAAGQLDGERIAFVKAKTKIQSDEAIAALDTAYRAERLEELDGRIAKIDQAQREQNLKKNLVVADRNGDPVAIVKAIDDILKYLPDDEGNAALRKRKETILVDEARKDLMAKTQDPGQASASVSLLQAWLKDHPGDRVVQARLDQLVKGLDMASQISAAKKAYRDRQWAAAIPLIKALYKFPAASVGMTRQEMGAMINECEVQILWTQAETLRKDNKYPEAIAKYEEILPKKPEWREKILRLVDAMTQDLNFAAEMAAANEAYAAKQYVKAIVHAKRALEIKPKSIEALMIITNSQYEQQMAEGRLREEQSDWKGALAYYTVAHGIKKDPAARQKMDEMKEKIKGEES